MNVRFSDADEFIAELARTPTAVAGRLVRVTTLTRPSMNGAITCVSVVATAKVLSGAAGHEDYDSVELEIYAGDLWRHEANDEATRARANKLVHEISEAAMTVGFDVAAGRYESERTS